MVRAFAGTISFTTVNIGLMTLPLAIFCTIANSAPFLTALGAHFYLKESISAVEVVAMIGSFIGVVLIAVSTPEDDGV